MTRGKKKKKDDCNRKQKSKRCKRSQNKNQKSRSKSWGGITPPPSQFDSNSFFADPNHQAEERLFSPIQPVVTVTAMKKSAVQIQNL